MADSLQDELKAFEKELSKLLVRFMKICDAVEASRLPGAPKRPKKGPAPPPTAAPVRAPSPPDLRAYV